MFQYGKFFRFCRRIFRLFSGKQTLKGEENIQPRVIYVTHHQNLYGPMVAMAWFPAPLRIWALHVFLERGSCFRQFYLYTFTKRLNWGKNRAKLAAAIVAPLVTLLLKSGGAIPVFRGRRTIFDTIQLSVDALCRGESLLISPDVDYTDGAPEVKEIYLGFLNLEKYYHRKTGEHVIFIPLYCHQGRRTVHIGKAVSFRDGVPFGEERQKVAEEIKDQLNAMGQ